MTGFELVTNKKKNINRTDPRFGRLSVILNTIAKSSIIYCCRCTHCLSLQIFFCASSCYLPLYHEFWPNEWIFQLGSIRRKHATRWDGSTGPQRKPDCFGSVSRKILWDKTQQAKCETYDMAEPYFWTWAQALLTAVSAILKWTHTI